MYLHLTLIKLLLVVDQPAGISSIAIVLLSPNSSTKRRMKSMNVSKGGYCIELPGIVNRSYFFRGIGDTYVMLYFEILHLIAE